MFELLFFFSSDLYGSMGFFGTEAECWARIREILIKRTSDTGLFYFCLKTA